MWSCYTCSNINEFMQLVYACMSTLYACVIRKISHESVRQLVAECMYIYVVICSYSKVVISQPAVYKNYVMY